MLIYIKNKDTLVVDEFKFKCCIGKSGLKKHKVEGDKSTPTGTYKIEKLYFRNKRVKKPLSNIKMKNIKPSMGWCNESKDKKYNTEIKIPNSAKHEKLFRRDNKYDYILVLNYNKKKIPFKGSAIFLHLTDNYKPTAGCIAINLKDFNILLKLINKNTKIKIN